MVVLPWLFLFWVVSANQCECDMYGFTEHNEWVKAVHRTPFSRSIFKSPVLEFEQEFMIFTERGEAISSVWLSKDEGCKNRDVKTKFVEKTSNQITVKTTKSATSLGEKELLMFACTNPPPGSNLQTTVTFNPIEGGGMTMLLVFAYFACISLSCLFTGLNLALLSLDVATLEMIKTHDEDPKKRQFAEDILPIRRDPNLMICTIILGNTSCNVLSTLAFGYLTKDVEIVAWQREILILVVPTIVLLVISEILPQIICTKYAMEMGALLQHVMRFFTVLMYPIAKALAWSLDTLVGKETFKSTALREIARFAQRKDKMAMIANNTIELRKRTAKDVMTPIEKVKKISDRKDAFPVISLNKEIVHKKFRESLKTSHTRIPVYKDGDPNHFCGILNVKDLLLIDDSLETCITVSTVMQLWPRTSTCRFVPSGMPVSQLMLELKKCSSLVFVTEWSTVGPGEYKNVTAGIVTLEDMLEEVIGEIYDEKDLRRVATAENAADGDDNKSNGKKLRKSNRKQEKEEKPLLDLQKSSGTKKLLKTAKKVREA